MNEGLGYILGMNGRKGQATSNSHVHSVGWTGPFAVRLSVACLCSPWAQPSQPSPRPKASPHLSSPVHKPGYGVVGVWVWVWVYASSSGLDRLLSSRSHPCPPVFPEWSHALGSSRKSPHFFGVQRQ